MPTPEFTRRDGSIVHDPRLGRLVSPESEQQRCMAYPLRTEPDRKPVHKVWGVPYLLDQWYSPMCVGFAVANRLISAGIQGMFVATFSDMERLLAEKGEACFFDEVVT